MYINIGNTIFKIFQIHIYPGKFYLKNLNVLCPKVGFLNNLNEKTEQIMLTKDD